MTEWPLARVIDFCSELVSSIEEYYIEKKHASTNFTFLSNLNLSGHSAGSCAEWGCRIRRLGYLSNFAALWADKVYVQTYIGSDYINANFTEQHEENYRYHLAGDINCILALRPLLKRGIVELVTPEFHYCENCAKEAKRNIGEFERITREYVDELLLKYINEVHMEAILDKVFLESGSCVIHMDTPEDFSEHGSVIITSDTANKWLLRKCNEALVKGKSGNIPLTKREVIKTKILQNYLITTANSAIYQRLFAGNSNVPYLTDSNLEVAFLDKLVNSEEMKEYNDILRSDLQYLIPIFQNLPIEHVLKVRSDDYESFLVYRNSLRYVMDEYIQKGIKITKEDSVQIYSDIIKPKLDALNNEMRNIRRTVKRGLLKDIAVLFTSAVIGLCSNVLPLQIGSSIGAGVTMRGMVERIAGLVETPQEIRNDNMYFLWKILK